MFSIRYKNKKKMQEDSGLQLGLLTSPSSNEWENLFYQFDTSYSGRISKEEFRRSIHKVLKHRVPKKVIEELLREADINGDNYISVTEFVRLAENSRGKQKRVIGALNKYMKSFARRQDLTDKDYEDQYSCCPPPLFMIFVSIIQIVIFIYIEFEERSDFSTNLEKLLIYNPYRRKEAWRFITYMFVHSGWNHLLVNILVQVALGIPMEMVHIWFRMLVVYMSGVLAGSLATSVSDPKVFLAGASGGVYSIMASHIANIIINWKEIEFAGIYLAAFISIFVIDTGSAIYERYVKQTIGNQVGYVAHFSGALAGLLVGIFVLRNLEKHRWEKKLQVTATILYVTFIIATICWNIFAPNYFLTQRV